MARALSDGPEAARGPDLPLLGRRIAVVGAGWAGLAAAVQAVQRGGQVTLIEMAHAPGGRARQLTRPDGARFDNGQHVLIGAYTATLALMRLVGADPQTQLLRMPLVLCQPDGRGLRLPAGAPMPAFLRGVLAVRGWRWAERLALLRAATGWALGGFRADATDTVAELCAGLPAAVRRDLIEPLCVAALNTPMAQASAAVFLRVLHDALLGGPGSADLLLPKVPLSALLPAPAWRWLQASGARCLGGRRVRLLERSGAGWAVDGESFDAVVLACSAGEAARLATALAPDWAADAAALRHEAIVTAYLADERLHLPQPMVALPGGADAPAQFAFDLGRLQSDDAGRGLFAFVASGAAAALTDGVDACGRRLLHQARTVFPGAFAGPDQHVLRHVAAERRATFACTPGLRRPALRLAPCLLAAGDYVDGPYPATLEGAVRCGIAAALAID